MSLPGQAPGPRHSTRLCIVSAAGPFTFQARGGRAGQDRVPLCPGEASEKEKNLPCPGQQAPKQKVIPASRPVTEVSQRCSVCSVWPAGFFGYLFLSFPPRPDLPYERPNVPFSHFALAAGKLQPGFLTTCSSPWDPPSSSTAWLPWLSYFRSCNQCPTDPTQARDVPQPACPCLDIAGVYFPFNLFYLRGKAQTSAKRMTTKCSHTTQTHDTSPGQDRIR